MERQSFRKSAAGDFLAPQGIKKISPPAAGRHLHILLRMPRSGLGHIPPRYALFTEDSDSYCSVPSREARKKVNLTLLKYVFINYSEKDKVD
ncbi:hypothetical protein [Acinetobacter sp. WCHAc010034]|uniref:hypothetical protein n=1 Tax=Acinetobacter sp. WCHAc010034 TaxID=1879049 RepID=UPI0013C2CF9E|nr:hypothetical protein [Acinetobacter sp. WCHAc010034]